jgi:hypothetical protein
MKTRKLQICCLTLVLAPLTQSARAQQKTVLPLPDSGNVTLPLDEYNRLVELAAKTPKKPDAPPLSFAIKRAELKLHVENDSALGSIQLEGELFKKGVIRIPLTSGITILDARQENKPLPLQQENGVQTAVLTGPSDFSITLNAGMPLRIEAGRATLNLPSPVKTPSPTSAPVSSPIAAPKVDTPPSKPPSFPDNPPISGGPVARRK